jgi:hypothetical protein
MGECKYAANPRCHFSVIAMVLLPPSLHANTWKYQIGFLTKIICNFHKTFSMSFRPFDLIESIAATYGIG